MRILQLNSIVSAKAAAYSERNRITKEKRNVPSPLDTNVTLKVDSRLALVSFYGKIKPAERLQKSNYKIPEYIGEISKARYFYGNSSVVDLSMGNPDIIPPKKARKVLKDKVDDVWASRYNSPKGESILFHSISKWMQKRFGVEIDPRKEIMVTSGASDAVDHIFTAYANYGDKVLIPDPGYSLYDDLIVRHDLKKETYPLDPKNGYLPDFSKMPADAKILILNYPHNPTGTFATKKTFEEAVKFANKNGILIIHDMDNSEITHSGKKPAGIMQVKGAKDVAFEVHTFSKAQSMPGLRVAFAISDEENIQNLLKAKYLSGGSVYTPVQAAAAAALDDEEGYIQTVNKIYRSRKNTAIKRLHELGSDAKPTQGTYYLWAKVPPDFNSDEFFKYVLHKSQIAFTPGTVFGDNGDGYVRIVMSANEKQINQAFDKIEKAGIRFDISKLDLPEETRNEIDKMVDGTYSIVAKADSDYAEYMKTLSKKRTIMQERIKGKDPKYNAFVVKDTTKLPWNLLRDGQKVYLQNQKEGVALFGEIRDLPPFSSPEEYRKLALEIKKQWKQEKYPQAEILPPYKNGKFYPDANYFVLKADDKIQAIANVEIQNDGIVWGRSLNSAPWNQGKDKQIKNCATSVIQRMVSFCLETGNNTLKFATDKPENISYYKYLGMKTEGERYFNGSKCTVLRFDKEDMEQFLKRYQVNLAF
ncbi:MAG: aminotransferase class I/II-fold pyridoxal phosphate-dependent enzyme [Clostridium sp.]|nr:aminotransferase class I/II-fold pyridoxal phosphate-dependent enzyme [Clostridium sp.]